uniref:PI31 proteasome regulator C-terminal domain-containing protein n=1 Tax=Rhizophora mucronata TaxID=61149 RepID=A0A2P2Q6A6_RHIMU
MANKSDEFVKNSTKLLGSSSKERSSGKPSRLGRHDEPRRDTRVPIYRFGGTVHPPVTSICHSDLFPGPGAGVYPTRGDCGSGGSMHLGPNDLRWFDGMDGQPGFPGGQPGVPPGARFDPYGPPRVPGFEPGRFARNPWRPPGGTHPDLEHFGGGPGFF